MYCLGVEYTAVLLVHCTVQEENVLLYCQSNVLFRRRMYCCTASLQYCLGRECTASVLLLYCTVQEYNVLKSVLLLYRTFQKEKVLLYCQCTVLFMRRMYCQCTPSVLYFLEGECTPGVLLVYCTVQEENVLLVYCCTAADDESNWNFTIWVRIVIFILAWEISVAQGSHSYSHRLPATCLKFTLIKRID